VYRVAISGSYGGMNLGDEAILQCILQQLRASVQVEVTVFSEHPEDTLRRHHVERAVDARRWSRDEVLAEVEGLDLFILGGGGILFDKWLDDHLREASLARHKGVPTAVYAVGDGPVQDPALRQAVRECFTRAELVTVRDHRTRQALDRLGVRRDIIVTADPAVLLEPEPLPKDALKREGLDGSRRLFGVSVREPGFAAPDIDTSQYHALLADAADYIVERFDATVVFVPMEPERQDLQHAHAVVSKMRAPQRASVLRGRYSAGQMLALMDHFDFAVGMRLHFLAFAALDRVPFVALPYASKVTGFLEELELETPPLQHLGAGQLLAYIDRSWDRQGTIKQLVNRNLPPMQARARETNELVVGLLGASRPTMPLAR